MRQRGAQLAILTIVLVQFIDLTLFSIGEFVISFQKIAALILLPLSLMLMQRLRIKLIFIIFAGFWLLVNSVAYWAHGTLIDERMLSANAVVLIGLVGAIVLYTSLTLHTQGILFLSRIWIIVGCLSAILTCMQAIGLVPLFFVPEEELIWRKTTVEGLMRGTGLKYDPNYQALVLTIGVVFSLYSNFRFKWITTVVLLLGIFFTFSRMGLLIAFFSILAAPFIQIVVRRQLSHRQLMKFIGIIMAFIIIIGTASAFLPSTVVYKYIGERIKTGFSALTNIGSYHHVADLEIPSSAATRILAAKGAWEVFIEHPVYGIGGYMYPKILKDKVGLSQSAHNTYLDFLMTGGLFGVGALVIYIYGLIKGLYPLHNILSHRQRFKSDFIFDTEVFLAQLSSFGIYLLFLTLNYNFILWFPLVLASAWRRNTQIELYHIVNKFDTKELSE